MLNILKYEESLIFFFISVPSPLSSIFQPLINTQSQIVTIWIQTVMLYKDELAFLSLHRNTPTLTSPLSPSFQPLIHTQSQMVSIWIKTAMLYKEELAFFSLHSNTATLTFPL
jgi:hypothetical protein